ETGSIEQLQVTALWADGTRCLSMPLSWTSCVFGELRPRLRPVVRFTRRVETQLRLSRRGAHRWRSRRSDYARLSDGTRSHVRDDPLDLYLPVVIQQPGLGRGKQL